MPSEPESEPAPAPRDASEVGSTAARTAWAEAAREVLLEAAGRYRALVNFKPLADAVQEASGVTTTMPMHQWLGGVLERVGRECDSRGEPLLSSLCVSVQGSVGSGYADVVEQLRGTRPADPDGHAAEERLACYRHWQAEGLPRDGGTPLRTAHFAPARKAAARKPARSAQGTRPQGRQGGGGAPSQADPDVPEVLHPGAVDRRLRLLRLRAPHRPRQLPTRRVAERSGHPAVRRAHSDH